MARILGLSFFFHDSAAAMVVDGATIAACTEERFTRRKHTSEFPKYAVQYCLEAAGVTSINEIDAVVFYEKPLVKLSRVVESLIGSWPLGLRTFSTRLPEFLSTKTNVYRVIEQALPGYRGEILFSDHHLSHAAAAFYGSPFAKAAILTVDGVGERETATIGVGDEHGITLSHVVHFPHSIGLLYSALTGYLGFSVNDGEWKVMGLAPYGQPSCLEQLRKLVTVNADGSFELDRRYFVHGYSSTWIAHRRRWEQLLGFPPRAPDEALLPQHQNLARSGQALVEEMLLKMAAEAKRLSGSDNLVIGGGVGLNSVANWKVEESGLFRNVWIHPAPGDDGGALGAALAVSRSMYDDRAHRELRDVYLGPAFANSQIEDFLRQEQQPFTSLADADLVEAIADLIAAGKIVGWFRGRMEFGPRALGSRSILGNARDPDMKARINARVKFREYFRPFAPSVPLDDVDKYFCVPAGCRLPFMVKVPQVRPEMRALIPAVTHEDGSGRVQTVTADVNPAYYQLLKAVGRRTGIPVVVNTSFNVRGEPIVCSPADAYRTFRLAGLDALVLENCLIVKTETAGLDLEAGYAASDRLERAIAGRADGHPDDATDYFRERPAMDVASEIRQTNPHRWHRRVHQRLGGGPQGRALHLGRDLGVWANTLAFHYAFDVTGLEPHAPARAHAVAVARILVGPGTARFVSTEAELPDDPYDLISCGDGRGSLSTCLEQLAPHRARLSRRGWYRLDVTGGGAVTTDSLRRSLAASALEIVWMRARRGGDRLVVWAREADHDE